MSDSNKPDNYHRNMDKSDETNHNPIGFGSASKNTLSIRNEADETTPEWVQRFALPAALKIVDCTSAPPTENENEIYLMDQSGDSLTTSAIAWQSGNTIRYTFSGSPDLSGYSNNDYLECSGASSAVLNGTFIITSVNDGSDYIEVTNTSVTDGTYDESTGSTCNVTDDEWDGVGKGYWAKFDGSSWQSFPPLSGMICYVEDIESVCAYNSGWQGTVQTKKISVTNAELLAWFTTKKELIAAPGSGYCIKVSDSLIRYSRGSTSFGTSKDTQIAYGTSGNKIFDFDDILETGSSVIERPAFGVNNVLNENESIVAGDYTQNPTLGDGTADIYLTYRIWKL